MSSVVALTSAAKGVTEAVEEALELLGSPLDAIQPGMHVLIKPNMFQLGRPHFYSNPEILTALARLVAARGARVTVAERLHNIYELLEGSDVHKYAEVRSFDDMPLRIVQIETAMSLRVPFLIPEPVLTCDYFIGVPQLRTHAALLMTNAMKNLIGLLPGYTTRLVHMTGVDESVVDLNILRPQNLVVCDLTTVIEGNYPIRGTPREVGLIVASTSAAAADLVSAEIAGFRPEDITYLQHASRLGLGPSRSSDIEVRGLTVAEASFDMEKAPSELVAPRDGIVIHAETACDACRRFLAGVLTALESELRGWTGEMTIFVGPPRLKELLSASRGAVVLVGNGLYESRNAGVFVEGCPPRAIQQAAFRYAMGMPVTTAERSQFRVPVPGAV